MDDLVRWLRSPVTVFYSYGADNGELLRKAAAEIERLTTYNTALLGYYDTAQDKIAALLRERDDLRKEVEALRADALRYRWLRDSQHELPSQLVMTVGGIHMDTDIDAAMKAGE